MQPDTHTHRQGRLVQQVTHELLPKAFACKEAVAGYITADGLKQLASTAINDVKLGAKASKTALTFAHDKAGA